MNAGAYGGELKDVIETVTVLTRDGQILERVKEQLDLSYRHSRMMENDEIILKARLQLSTGQQDEIYAKMEELKQKRIEKQPLEYPSAGSTFKRPEGYFAGKLIEDAGLRGFRIGDAQVSEKHCGFVINRGNATAAVTDVRDFAQVEAAGIRRRRFGRTHVVQRGGRTSRIGEHGFGEPLGEFVESHHRRGIFARRLPGRREEYLSFVSFHSVRL